MPEATALIAALVAAACPIAMQMGTTAQPEPLFALLVLGAAIAFQQARPSWTAALLAPAVLLRYEAWAALAARSPGCSSRSASGLGCGAPRSGLGRWMWIAVGVPVALILAWAALRAPVDGRWFGFLRQTREFANDATHTKLGAAKDVLYYPAWVPVRVLGVALLPVPFGVARTVRQQGLRFVALPVACLGMVSLSWVTRASLGLDRHFVCVVPLYATFAAQGVVALGDAAARAMGAMPGRVVAGVASLIVLAGLAVHLDLWMAHWRGSIERGWPDRAGLARYLPFVPEGAGSTATTRRSRSSAASIAVASTATGWTTPRRGRSFATRPAATARPMSRHGAASSRATSRWATSSSRRAPTRRTPTARVWPCSACDDRASRGRTRSCSTDDARWCSAPTRSRSASPSRACACTSWRPSTPGEPRAAATMTSAIIVNGRRAGEPSVTTMTRAQLERTIPDFDPTIAIAFAKHPPGQAPAIVDLPERVRRVVWIDLTPPLTW